VEEPADEEAKWRSRMLMTDVIRFARHFHYDAVIVENVPDILKWAGFPRWLREMSKEGYDHKVVTLNSAFALGVGRPAPQLRDRVYVVLAA
jgi:DNA (cytosine-5)-methyltransferase 1